MVKLLALSLLVLGMFSIEAQAQSFEKEVANFQRELNAEFRNPQTSPLSKKELKKFFGHYYFPIDEDMRFEAMFVRTAGAEPFKMETTSRRKPVYEEYGKAIFKMNGKEITLSIYQSHQLRTMDDYEGHLFLPFKDLTNGKQTYEGGRYLDLTIPEGDTIIIDFNMAYPPYCAFNPAYSCPIPPKENHLNVKIEAGVKNLDL